MRLFRCFSPKKSREAAGIVAAATRILSPRAAGKHTECAAPNGANFPKGKFIKAALPPQDGAKRQKDFIGFV